MLKYTGRRLRTKEDIHLLMYKNVLQVSHWESSDSEYIIVNCACAPTELDR